MDEDEDFMRAIALSMQDASKPAPAPIVISDDEGDEELAFQIQIQLAMEASKAETSARESSYPSSRSASPPPPAPVQDSAPKPKFLSERAQMEKERLERQKRSRPDDSVEMDAEPPKRPHTTDTRHRGSAPSAGSSKASSSFPSNIPTIDRIFWDAEARQVANRHAEPRRDGQPTFRLTEVLGKKSDISFAILSSYSLALSWVYEFFDRQTPVIVVAHDSERQEAMHNVFPNWVRTVPKLHNNRGCMHMKFMLIFYKTGRLRVVISTANLVDMDWRDIENTVWLQDVPLRSSPIAHDPKATTDFPAMLQHVLHKTYVKPALGALRKERPDVPIKVIEDIRCRWDWSKVKAQLVPSVAGKHEGWPNVIMTGHVRLMKAVRDMGLRTGKGMGKQLMLECQGSSIGTYTTQWLNEFHWSARGESAEDWLDIKKAHRGKEPYPPVKILFPTLKTVRASVLGEPGGGTMFCAPNQWKGANFPRDHFYDSKSKAGGVLMHSKMILALLRTENTLGGKGKAITTNNVDSGSETEDSDDDIVEVQKEVGWAYIGSHNFTPSAWGNLSGSSFNPVLNVTNYEIGVVFPLKDEAQANKIACWERPPKKYVVGEDIPWMQNDSLILQQLRVQEGG